MQNNRKKLGIFIIIIGLIIILLIIYFLLWRKPATTVIETPVTPGISGQLPASGVGSTTPSDKPRNYQQYNIANEPAHKINANDLGKISMSFAERFGSFSNQSNYSNFEDLKVYGITDSMKTWVDKNVADLKSQAQDSAYYGITTQAITFEVKNFDDAKGHAEILVVTRRRESTEQINGGTPYSQNLTLSLIKVGDEWLFDKAYWEKK